MDFIFLAHPFPVRDGETWTTGSKHYLVDFDDDGNFVIQRKEGDRYTQIFVPEYGNPVISRFLKVGDVYLWRGDFSPERIRKK